MNIEDDKINGETFNVGGKNYSVEEIAKITNKDLLPTEEENSNLIIRMVDQGAVDGLIPKKQYSVDGFSIEENNKILSELRNLS